MYKSLWNLIHNHVKEAHVTPVFLVASTVGWTIIGLLPGCIGYLILCNWIRYCNTRIPGRDFFPVQSFLTPGVTSRVIISKNSTAKKILPILEYSPTDIPGYTLQDFFKYTPLSLWASSFWTKAESQQK